MSQNTLNPCAVPPQPDRNDDAPPPFCPDPCADPSRRAVDGLGWDEEGCSLADGASALCDPMQSGLIVNDLDNPNPDVIYRYSRGLRGCDEAMTDLFRNVVVLDGEGKAHPVPIVWATQERAVAALLQSNVRQDSTVVDRIQLPTMAIYANGYSFNASRYTYSEATQYYHRERSKSKPRYVGDERAQTDVYGVSRGLPVDISYTLYAWTMFAEDMNQIAEQVIGKFNKLAYIRVRGVSWEIGVELNSIGQNTNIEVGDKEQRLIKFEFGMTAETFIPQPIKHKKTVLRVRAEFLDGVGLEDTTGVIARIDESVKEINDRDHE